MNIHNRISEILEASPFLTYPGVRVGDPNRGGVGRAVPKLPRGVDPYGSGYPSRGKLQARLSGLSDAGRKRYYREIGMRSRVASRGGVTGRLFPVESVEVSEGSRGLARHGRIVKALERKQASMAKVPAGERGTAAYHSRFMNKLTLSKGQQERDRVQISRERVRAGLAPGIPSKTVSPAKGDETGTWRIKSGSDRAPKTVLKYRAAAKAKRSVSEGAVKDALADYLYSIPKEAIKELRPVMKTVSLQKRFRDINSVLKRHGFTADFMGSRPANVINDYYETFFG